MLWGLLPEGQSLVIPSTQSQWKETSQWTRLQQARVIRGTKPGETERMCPAEDSVIRVNLMIGNPTART